MGINLRYYFQTYRLLCGIIFRHVDYFAVLFSDMDITLRLDTGRPERERIVFQENMLPEIIKSIILFSTDNTPLVINNLQVMVNTSLYYTYLICEGSTSNLRL